ncbi:MAG: hypothetical protein ACREJ0_22655 [Geminicoccaceae bacterium]
MTAEQILREISEYCREAKLAESTFGRLAVNDGKLTARLRYGGRITTETLDRIRAYMANHQPGDARSALIDQAPAPRQPTPAGEAAGTSERVPERHFRFFDNRQKYLLFVNTCSEKWVIGQRVSLELANLHPRPPALRVFDAGVGDATVLARVMRAMHARYPTMPFYVVGKEISLEDVRLTLEKLPDRFLEHPATVVVLTNLYYAEAPWLTVRSLAAANSLVWHELALSGTSAHEFEAQITGLHPFLSETWRAAVSKTTGNPIYERPVVLVLYREDHKFLLDSVIPRRGQVVAEFDLVIASHPYRARATTEFKATKVIAPLARALGPGGRLIGIHSYGDNPGMAIIEKVWPGDDPFRCDRHQVLKAVRQALGSLARGLNFNAYSDERSIFRYAMHALPSEVSGSIGTSTLLAAWNAAIYVAQVEDDRLGDVAKDGRYIEATRAVLRAHGGL